MNKKNLIFVTLLISVVLIMSFISAGWFSGKVMPFVSAEKDCGEESSLCKGGDYAGSCTGDSCGVSGEIDQREGDTQCYCYPTGQGTYTVSTFTAGSESIGVRERQSVSFAPGSPSLQVQKVDKQKGIVQVNFDGKTQTFYKGETFTAGQSIYKVQELQNSLFGNKVTLQKVTSSEINKPCPGDLMNLVMSSTSSVNRFLTSIVYVNPAKTVLNIEGDDTNPLGLGEQVYSLNGNGLTAYIWKLKEATSETDLGEVDICLTKEGADLPTPAPSEVAELGNYELISGTFEIPTTGLAKGSVNCEDALGSGAVVLGGGFALKNAVETGVIVNAPTTSTSYEVNLNVDTSAGTEQQPTLIVYATCARQFFDIDSEHKSFD